MITYELIAWIAVGLAWIGAFTNIMVVGKPRGPITPATAAMTVFWAVIATVLLLAAS